MIPIRPDILCPRCRRINSRRATVCRYCTQALGFVDGNNCYFLVRVIKTGGQAVIFEAIDDNSHRTYAIKESGQKAGIEPRTSDSWSKSADPLDHF